MKRLHPSLLPALMAILGTFFSATDCVNAQSAGISNVDKAVALLNSFNTGDPAPLGYINSARYVQHNLAVADGLAGFGEVMKNAPEGGFKAKVVRAFEDGNYVITHTQYDFFGPKAGFDVFRFEDGKIVEHWDNLIAVTPPNPSGRTQFDGANEIVDLDKTELNKQVVRDLLTEVFIGGNMGKVADYISDKTYLQHNPAVADGLKGLAEAFSNPNAPKIECQKLHAVFGQGNFALSISEGKVGGKDASFYDLFRLENGKIVEHWDVIESVMPKAERKNSNGKFGFNGIVEVTSFKIKPDVDLNAFKAKDKTVEANFTSKQPGFVRRQSGINDKGELVVVVYWETMADAAASMKKFMGDQSVADYAQMIDPASMKMSRFALDSPYDAAGAEFVELMSFGLGEGTDLGQFNKTNHQVETDFTGKRNGFVQRLTGVNEDGVEVVAVYWSNKDTSDASMQPFMQAPIAKKFMGFMNQSSISMGRYELLK